MLRLMVTTLLLSCFVFADTLIFTNGDQLSGELVSATVDKITFKSVMTGTVSVDVKNVRQLRTDKAYAVVEHQTLVGAGKIEWTASTLSLLDEAGYSPVNTDPTLLVIDRVLWERAISERPGMTHGWNGQATAGFSLLRATQNHTSFDGSLSLARTTPGVAWLDRHSRTLLTMSGSYGRTTQEGVPELKTEVFHSEVERDRYFSPRLFVLAISDLDHNFAQGLSFQQGYGGGVGWSAIAEPNQSLDLRADLRYTRQAFIDDGPDKNLVGSQMSEKYYRKLPHAMVFQEQLAITPSFADSTAYDVHANSALSLPLYGRFHVSLGLTESYLNEPAPGSKKNSVQFLTGLQYAFK